jgi:poly(A)-specific ribonuclease
VIRKITESGKPVVGHNMLLDLCHTVQQFVAPLPEDYNDFKSLVKSALPKILDTKLLAKTSPLKEDIPHSSLEELIKTLSLSPFKMPQVEIESDQMGYELGDNAVEKYHEAGYDAFVTGVCFIAMRDRLRVLSTADPKTDVTAPFMNKVNLMRILDIPYLNLAGEDVVPNRDHVFYVTFPPEWKTTDLLQLFSPFGSVHITWLSDTTAYVGLREFVANSKSVVISTLNCSSMYSIVPYGLHKKLEAMYEMQNTGITPIMEKTTIFNQNKWPTSKLDQAKKHPPQQTTESKKRSASPEKEAFKRSKSVTEDTNKMFEEPPWE